jgi:hypothetical protein
MGIQIQWDQAQPNLVVWTITGRWNIGELERALQTCDRLVDTAEQPVDFVIDIAHSGLIPRQFIAFLRRYETHPHPLNSTLSIWWTEKDG